MVQQSTIKIKKTIKLNKIVQLTTRNGPPPEGAPPLRRAYNIRLLAAERGPQFSEKSPGNHVVFLCLLSLLVLPLRLELARQHRLVDAPAPDPQPFGLRRLLDCVPCIERPLAIHRARL
jgi:hypothetical protein